MRVLKAKLKKGKKVVTPEGTLYTEGGWIQLKIPNKIGCLVLDETKLERLYKKHRRVVVKALREPTIEII